MLTVKKSDKKPELLNVRGKFKNFHEHDTIDGRGIPMEGAGDNQYYGFPVASHHHLPTAMYAPSSPPVHAMK